MAATADQVISLATAKAQLDQTDSDSLVELWRSSAISSVEERLGIPIIDQDRRLPLYVSDDVGLFRTPGMLAPLSVTSWRYRAPGAKSYTTVELTGAPDYLDDWRSPGQLADYWAIHRSGLSGETWPDYEPGSVSLQAKVGYGTDIPEVVVQAVIVTMAAFRDGAETMPAAIDYLLSSIGRR